MIPTTELEGIVQRVRKTALAIARSYQEKGSKPDLLVVELSALLHDVQWPNKPSDLSIEADSFLETDLLTTALYAAQRMIPVNVNQK